MSARSEELRQLAYEKLRTAQRTLEIDEFGASAGASYYAMLTAARALLSERDWHSKTHSGSWHLFHREFVREGPFDAELYRAAADAQNIREDVDYQAVSLDRAQAEELVALAERFLAAVDALA